MVLPNYDPSYLGGRDRKIIIGGQPGQKHKTLSDKQTKKIKGLVEWFQVVE
jgi:hypothetical protein